MVGELPAGSTRTPLRLLSIILLVSAGSVVMSPLIPGLGPSIFSCYYPAFNFVDFCMIFSPIPLGFDLFSF